MQINVPQQEGVRGGMGMFTGRIGALAGKERLESRLFGWALC